ncbi:hypothetical protein GCM10022381_28230 [Leifsonia kafniensis]|uniref:Putative regulatory protein FmdB zinc ribbon domain-containing protein n=1 Tax=Leifsonia kafniensis TaxID=475957 RepID=A0ABP7KQ30_9MICO
MILVDYKCSECQAVAEALVARPAPANAVCARCGADARRQFTTAGLMRGASIAPRITSTACADNPDVPGLCHVGPAAKKSLIARYRGDDRTLAAEQKRQTREFEQVGPPAPEKVFGHAH